MQSDELATQARALLEAESHAILSTQSVQHAGFPFGSLVPYAVMPTGAPVVLISTLAVHTKNLVANPRCSLMVLEANYREEPVASGRLTVLGVCTKISSDEIVGEARQRYLARHPSAEQTLGMSDFSFYMVTPLHIRFVAGFGRMGWFQADAWSGGGA